MNPSAPSSTEALLAQTGWMRALALGLVRDGHAADDVAQDAALAALLHPPPAGVELRPWLAQVVRRLAWRRARSERRRSERESAANEPAGPDGPGETLARLDLQRALLEAVRALEEPVRTTIVQRYFEGCSAAEIAASSGVPASTVRARLARGLELLRSRLDRESGSRAAWMALVAPLVPREFAPVATGAGAVTASTLATGALTMTLAKLALVASAALVGGLAWWNLAPSDSPARPVAQAPQSAAELTAPPPTDPAMAATAPAAVERSTAAATQPPTEPAERADLAPAPEQRTGRIDLRVVDARGVPWAGAQLAVHRPGVEEAVVRGESGADGRAELELEVPRYGLGSRGVAAGTFALVVRRPGCSTRREQVVVREGETTHLGEIVLVEAARLRGRVIDEAGIGVAGAHVGALDAGTLDSLDDTERDRFARVGSDVLDALVARVSDADGSFDLDDVAPGRVVLWAHAPERHWALSHVLELEARELVEGLTLTLPELAAAERVAGQVVGPDGKGRSASLHRDMRSSKGGRMDFIETDMQGRFDFPAAHLDSVYELAAHDGFDEFAPARVVGLRPGDIDVVIAFREGSTLRLRLSDESGAPVTASELWISSSTTTYQARFEALEPGAYEVEVPSGEFGLRADAIGYRTARSARFAEGAAPAEVALTLRRAVRVSGIVRAEGAPVAGARISAHEYDADGVMTVNELRCRLSPFTSGEATCDAEGRFELFVDSDSPFVVRASAAGWVDGESEVLDAADTRQGLADALELTLGPGGSIEGRALVPAGESPAGRIVGAHRGDGRPISTRTAEDGTFRFERLMPGDWYVLPLAAEFPPHGGSYSSTSTTDAMPWSCRVEEGRSTRFDLALE